jgi:hypothetical protein
MDSSSGVRVIDVKEAPVAHPGIGSSGGKRVTANVPFSEISVNTDRSRSPVVQATSRNRCLVLVVFDQEATRSSLNPSYGHNSSAATENLLDKNLLPTNVKRSRTPEDRRLVPTTITADGLRMLAAIDEPLLRLHREQLGHLTGSEPAELNRLLVAKVQMRKKVRGLRGIEQTVLKERRHKTDEQSEALPQSSVVIEEANPENAPLAEEAPAGDVILKYCAVVRGILNDDQGGPLHPPGLRMAEALGEVRDSIQRNLDEKKGGPQKSNSTAWPAALTEVWAR